MLVLNRANYKMSEEIGTVVSDPLLHIVFIVLKILYCTLLSERNTSKVILSCLFLYLAGLQSVLVKVRNLNDIVSNLLPGPAEGWNRS